MFSVIHIWHKKNTKLCMLTVQKLPLEGKAVWLIQPDRWTGRRPTESHDKWTICQKEALNGLFMDDQRFKLRIALPEVLFILYNYNTRDGVSR